MITQTALPRQLGNGGEDLVVAGVGQKPGKPRPRDPVQGLLDRRFGVVADPAILAEQLDDVQLVHARENGSRSRAVTRSIAVEPDASTGRYVRWRSSTRASFKSSGLSDPRSTK